jgi:hypothetical protein
MCSGWGMLLEQHPSPRTQSTPPHSRPPTYYNIRTIYHPAVTTVLRSWRWVNVCPKHVELIQRSIKLLLLHLVGHLYYSPAISFFVAPCPSVRLSFRPPAWNNSGSPGRIFTKCIWILSNMCRENSILIKIWQNGYFTWRSIYIYDHILFSSSYNEKCFKYYRENLNTHFVSNNCFFQKSRRLWDNVEKYCRTGQATDDNMAHANFMLKTKGTYTIGVCSTYRFSTEKMVTQTRLDITLYV